MTVELREPAHRVFRRAMPLPILTYHSLDESGSPVSVSPNVFERHLDRLARAGYTVLPLSEALARLRQPTVSDERLVTLTFDDAYASVVSRAFPELKRRGWRATIFPVVDHVGRLNDWPGQPSFIPRARLLGWDELRELATSGWEIGAHSRTHPDLTSRADLSGEVAGAKDILAERLGQSVTAFAYPYGRYDRRVKAAVAGSFAVSCTTEMRFARLTSDPSALERLDMWYFSRWPLLDLLGSPAMGMFVDVCQALRRERSRVSVVRRGLASQLGIAQ